MPFLTSVFLRYIIKIVMDYYTGLIIRESLKDEQLLKNFDVTEEHTGTTFGWHLVNVRIPSPYLSLVLPSIQYEINEEGKWYVHLTNGVEQIIIYAKKVFRFPQWDRKALKAARNYGKRLGIAREHLLFF